MDDMEEYASQALDRAQAAEAVLGALIASLRPFAVSRSKLHARLREVETELLRVGGLNAKPQLRQAFDRAIGRLPAGLRPDRQGQR